MADATTPETIREQVKEGYARTAVSAGSCCGGASNAAAHARAIGYTDADLARAPADANLGVGCGNPLSYAGARPGETILDLGSGAGFDAFIAADVVGESGHVIGVDMTPEMIAKATANAEKVGRSNVEFRQGLIEDLPVDSASVDVVISNCVINLSPEKARVMREAFRVLKPGGRLAISDIVLTGELPESVRGSIDAYVACIAGASHRDDYLAAIGDAGFADVEVKSETPVLEVFMQSACADPVLAAAARQLSADEIQRIDDSIRSMKILATKPAA
jgi:arsenite methyltransferase